MVSRKQIALNALPLHTQSTALLPCDRLADLFSDSALGCVLKASDKRRNVTDMLVWTSFVYVLPSVYGLYVHQVHVCARLLWSRTNRVAALRGDNLVVCLVGHCLL